MASDQRTRTGGRRCSGSATGEQVPELCQAPNLITPARPAQALSPPHGRRRASDHHPPVCRATPPCRDDPMWSACSADCQSEKAALVSIGQHWSALVDQSPSQKPKLATPPCHKNPSCQGRQTAPTARPQKMAGTVRHQAHKPRSARPSARFQWHCGQRGRGQSRPGVAVHLPEPDPFHPRRTCLYDLLRRASDEVPPHITDSALSPRSEAWWTIPRQQIVSIGTRGVDQHGHQGFGPRHGHLLQGVRAPSARIHRSVSEVTVSGFGRW